MSPLFIKELKLDIQERHKVDEFTQVRQGELQDKHTPVKVNVPEIQLL